MRKVAFILLCGLFFCLGTTTAFAKMNMCEANGKKLYGKVKIVDSFPDIKVKVVSAFPDLKVKKVSSFPDTCGEWQFVDSFPDFTIQYVNSFPDITIEFVDAFPGI